HVQIFREEQQLTVELYWRGVVNRPPLDATIFIHLTAPDGSIIAQQDSRPWGGAYPTFIWDADEIVLTQHRFESSDVDNLGLRIGMYIFPDGQTPQNLPVQVEERIYENGLLEFGAVLDYLPQP